MFHDAFPPMEGVCDCHVARRDSYGVCPLPDRNNQAGDVWRFTRTPSGDVHTDVNLERRTLARAVYRAAVPHLGRSQPWGMLSGVRPAKLIRNHLENGGTLQGAKTFLEREYFVSSGKAALCMEAGKIAADVHKSMEERDISLYAHIPFCPSRCTYCSFISAAGDAFQRWGDAYFSRLLDELEMLGAVRRELGMRVHNIYVGGGTPAVYSPEALTRFCEAIKRACHASGRIYCGSGTSRRHNSGKTSCAARRRRHADLRESANDE